MRRVFSTFARRFAKSLGGLWVAVSGRIGGPTGGRGVSFPRSRGRVAGPEGARVLTATGARALAMLRAGFKTDADAGRLFFWWPVAFGSGSGIYFGLSVEPPAAPAAILAAGLLAVAVRLRIRGRAVPAAVMLAGLFAAGFHAADRAVDAAAAPRLDRERTAIVTGVVETVEDRGPRGRRVLVRVTALDPPPRGGLPVRVRLTLRGEGVPGPGEPIRVRARLAPPQAPLYPGGYDFARTAWFERVGAVGYGLGAAEAGVEAPPPSGLDAAAAAVERFRTGVSARIRAVLPGDEGAIAAALTVGDRGSIDPETDEAMRISGLSHILSISGLHMAIVAACLFGGLRAVAAAVPWIALSLPVKSIAAAVALLGTLAYMVVAGSSLPTQRSAVMIAVALIAVMAGRQPISLRSVALAALVVLAVQPQAVVDPGAQMSFAAVTALVAGFEAVMRARRDGDPGEVNPVLRLLGRLWRWLLLSLLSSLVAGLATAPIALYVFGRSAPFGLVANLASTPVVGFVVMPAGVLAALAMPFGLDAWPLRVMGAGIAAMVDIAEAVAAATPSGGTLGRPDGAGILTIMAGGIWLCLWAGPQRHLGWPAILVGAVLAMPGDPPDLVVSAGGGRLLYGGGANPPVILGRPSDFEARIWLAAIGDPRDPGDASLQAGVRCDPDACILPVDAGSRPGADSRPGAAAPLDAEATVSPGPAAVPPPPAAMPAGDRAPPPATPAPTNLSAARSSVDGQAGRPGDDPASSERRWKGSGRQAIRDVAVALVLRPAAFADECAAARLVVTPLIAPPWCRAATTVLDRRSLAGLGATTYVLSSPRDPNAPLRLRRIGRSVPRSPRPWQTSPSRPAQ